jgi:hypothetical protein
MVDPVEKLKAAALEVAERAEEFVGDIARETMVQVVITVEPESMSIIRLIKEYRSKYEVKYASDNLKQTAQENAVVKGL